jgi:hypothetical protein
MGCKSAWFFVILLVLVVTSGCAQADEAVLQ